jgi:alpha-tubulin suppressor-like RCC1 family protein
VHGPKNLLRRRLRGAAALALALFTLSAPAGLAIPAAVPVSSGTPTGLVWAWGDDASGELGDGGNVSTQTPVQVLRLGDVTAVSAGYSHSLALKANGAVWAWGDNRAGELGNGSTRDSNVPLPVLGLGAMTAVVAGQYFSLAVGADGSVWAWGDNRYGQLGDGTTTRRTQPVAVQNLSGVIAVAAGNFHSLALKNDGTIWAWGDNRAGELGGGSKGGFSAIPQAAIGLDSVVALGAGGQHSLAVRADGSAWSWGSNVLGELGNGTFGDSNPTPARVQGLDGATAVAAGTNHSLALKADGNVWAWGDNYQGQLGTVDSAPSYVPVQVANLSGVVAIGAGFIGSQALKADGTVWSWGGAPLGTIPLTGSRTPVQATVLRGATAISPGIMGSHALAVTRPASPRLPPFGPAPLTLAGVGGHSVTLAWDDHAGNESGFVLERRSGDDPYAPLGSTLAPNTTQFVDFSAKRNSTYLYRLKAIGSGGNSPYSNEIQVITLPTAPTNLAASLSSPYQVLLQWKDTPDTTATGYTIERKSGVGGFEAVGSQSPPVASYRRSGNVLEER